MRNLLVKTQPPEGEKPLTKRFSCEKFDDLWAQFNGVKGGSFTVNDLAALTHRGDFRVYHGLKQYGVESTDLLRVAKLAEETAGKSFSRIESFCDGEWITVYGKFYN